MTTQMRGINSVFLWCCLLCCTRSFFERLTLQMKSVRVTIQMKAIEHYFFATVQSVPTLRLRMNS